MLALLLLITSLQSQSSDIIYNNSFNLNDTNCKINIHTEYNSTLPIYIEWRSSNRAFGVYKYSNMIDTSKSYDCNISYLLVSIYNDHDEKVDISYRIQTAVVKETLTSYSYLFITVCIILTIATLRVFYKILNIYLK